MSQQPIENTQNNFTGGLKTEYTGLNFPENAATDTDNCVYELVGNVTRRLGINFEENYSNISIDTTNKAVSTYLWTNAGGDGETKLLVSQVGTKLYFFDASHTTTSTPLSKKKLLGEIDITQYTVNDVNYDQTQAATFADGNGYLFVFHPDCICFYVSYDPITIEVHSNIISIQIRDMFGIPEIGTPDGDRPAALSEIHLYNLLNQGWAKGSPWTAYDTTSILSTLNWTAGKEYTFVVQSGLAINVGDAVIARGKMGIGLTLWTQLSGVVVSYSGTSLTINTFAYSDSNGGTGAGITQQYTIAPTNSGFITSWYDAIGNYPANSDVWWRYKDDTGVYNPVVMYSQVSVSTGPAPKGHYLLDAFYQQRTLVSAIDGLTPVVTTTRPTNGAWFSGRIWYTGTNGSQGATGNAHYYTWSENIYFSQVVQTENDFGKCYQANDPTDQNLFDLLPTDGGVIVVQGSGAIYKLFSIQNGLLVFAQNGIWFITGSRGIGFAANDYTLTKISSIQSISTTSFVNVQGLPYFWNDEGIYTVTPSQQGLGLQVVPITLDSILTYYMDIPKLSKRYVQGDYNPIDYTIQWIYRSSEESGISDRYSFDRSLVFNTAKKSFYPYSMSGIPKISSINYIPNTGLPDSPEPVFKYLTKVNTSITFSDIHDDRLLDWYSYDGIGTDYESYFVTGYRVHGNGIRKFQAPYVYIYSNSEEPTSYKIQGLWDYANSGNSGKWTTIQLVTNALTRFSKLFRKHKIRGRGMSLQFKVSSVTGMNFDIDGWAVRESQNAGV